MEWVYIIVGVALLILHICVIVAIFGMAKNIEALKELYVDGEKTVTDDRIATPVGTIGVRRFYKLPVDEITKEEKKKEDDDFVSRFIEDKKKQKERSRV